MFASVIGEVFGVVGTASAIAEIFLYEPKMFTDKGDAVTSESL